MEDIGSNNNNNKNNKKTSMKGVPIVHVRKQKRNIEEDGINNGDNNDNDELNTSTVNEAIDEEGVEEEVVDPQEGENEEDIADNDDADNEEDAGDNDDDVETDHENAAAEGEDTTETTLVPREKQPVLPLMEYKPQTVEEWHDWLELRKQKWRDMRKAKKQLSHSTTGRVYGNPYRPNGHHQYLANATMISSNYTIDGKPKKPLSVMDMVKSASLQASYGFWQIIELQELEYPGEFVMWAMTAPTQLQKFHVTIPRIMYVNTRGKDAEEAAIKLNGKKVVKELPHGRNCMNLYEVTIPEKKFLRNEKALHLFLSNSQVEGVYESQVPLWLRGIIQVGCVCRVSANANTPANNKQYKLSDLEFVNVKSHPYLEPVVATYRKIFLYYAIDKSRQNGSLGIMGLFILDSVTYQEGKTTPKCMGKAYVWLINGLGNNAFNSKPPFQKIYRKFTDATTIATNLNETDIKFNTTFVSNNAEAWKQCNERLNKYQTEHRGATVVIAQGTSLGVETKQWRHAIPALHDYPLSLIPGNSVDDMFPAVGWVMFAAERLIQRFVIFPRWFDDRLKCARYAHIPVCNLRADSLTTMIDVIYSRQLIQNRHLLWATEAANLPDIGGSSSLEYSDALIWNQNDETDLNNKETILNEPGVYRSVCIELDIYGLAVCAIMSSNELDAEGLTTVSGSLSAAAKIAQNSSILGGSSTSTTNNNTTLATSSKARDDATDSDSDDDDEDNKKGKHDNFDANDGTVASAINNVTYDVSCARAFNVFKAFVAKCIEDVGKRSDPISDSILTALYRYLCGYGNGLLSDPALHKVIYELMKKLFKKLISSFRKLGTKIIYADFGRIVVCTNKHDYAAAKEYIDFILAAITNKDIFAYVQINMKTCWEQLLWLSPENSGGIAIPEHIMHPELLNNNNSDNVVDIDDDEEIMAESTTTVLKNNTDINSSLSQSNTIRRRADSNNDDDNESAIDMTEEEDAPNDFEDSDTEKEKATAKSKEQKQQPTTPPPPPAKPESKTVKNFFEYFNKNSAYQTSKNAKNTTEKLGKSKEYDFLDDINNNNNNTTNHSQKSDINIKKIKKSYDKPNTFTRYDDEADLDRDGYYSGYDDDEEDKVGRLLKAHKNKKKVSTNSRQNHDSDDDESNDNDSNNNNDNDHDDNDDFIEEDDDGVEDLVKTHWNLATYFPNAASEYFYFIIGEFMIRYRNHRALLCEKRNQKLIEMSSFEYTQKHKKDEAEEEEEIYMDDESIHEATLDFMRDEIRGDFTTLMLRIIDELNTIYSNYHIQNENNNSNNHGNSNNNMDNKPHQHKLQSYSSQNAKVFPIRAGSHLNMTSPSLEFVKAVTHVMALDGQLHQEVISLRRLLLAQLKVREFSADSRFQDPCLSYILHDVICSYCSTCRDLDLLRDTELTGDDIHARWKCNHCSNKINVEEVENRLLEAVDNITVSYLLQDFHCNQTNRVTKRLATANSELCEPLVMSISTNEARLKLSKLSKIAVFYGFDYLESAVNDLL